MMTVEDNSFVMITINGHANGVPTSTFETSVSFPARQPLSAQQLDLPTEHPRSGNIRIDTFWSNTTNAISNDRNRYQRNTLICQSRTQTAVGFRVHTSCVFSKSAPIDGRRESRRGD